MKNKKEEIQETPVSLVGKTILDVTGSQEEGWIQITFTDRTMLQCLLGKLDRFVKNQDTVEFFDDYQRKFLVSPCFVEVKTNLKIENISWQDGET